VKKSFNKIICRKLTNLRHEAVRPGRAEVDRRRDEGSKFLECRLGQLIGFNHEVLSTLSIEISRDKSSRVKRKKLVNER
jgi:hypothetical protein